MSSKGRKRKNIDVNLPFHGERTCERSPCTNGGYFYDPEGKQILCGMHSKKLKNTRIELQKDLLRKKKLQLSRYEDHQRSVELEAKKNRTSNLEGTVICTPLKMMKAPELVPGFLQVWPNNKHDKKPGFGCGSLSPMRLHAKDHEEYIYMTQEGEVVQPFEAEVKNATLVRLPPALSIENYHQFNKCFPEELDEQGEWPTQHFWQRLMEGYKDPVPHRHKFPNRKLSEADRKKGLLNRNTPLYSLRTDSQGHWKIYTYLKSRWFYCSMYEKRVVEQPDFQTLLDKKKQGYNLQILGYDAYPVTKDLYSHYLDCDRPFGHELVLFCMLTIPNSKDRPWNRFRTIHPEYYM